MIRLRFRLRWTLGELLLSCILAGSIISRTLASEGVGTGANPADDKDHQNTCSVSKVVELWQEREAMVHADFPIGPGDVITISVPEVDEIQRQQIRVEPDGTIGLPLIGTMKVAGMTQNELRTALSKALSIYMKFPRVELFVERYQARDVAVIGAVQKPGLYDLANSDQSIIEMIGLAGGMTSEAAEKVIFVPPNHSRGATRPSSNGQVEVLRKAAGNNSIVGKTNSLTMVRGASADLASSYVGPDQGRFETPIDLKGRSWIQLDLSQPTNRACLELPARPGDVVMIPIAGQVMVQGWVRNPGAFRITPGMTVLGAVSAAGGAMFSRTAELLRTDPNPRETTEFSLSRLANGSEPDVPVQSGDVVVVEKSAAGALPYAFYQLFTHFGTGFALPAP
jgi:polysaccharide biosynthesis/export protein